MSTGRGERGAQIEERGEEAAGSLILGSGVALELALGEESDAAGLPAAAYARAEEMGRFTGDRIFSGNPKLYRAIVALLGRGIPYREISEICSVSVNTVCAVSAREGTPIETIRERIARLGYDVAALTVEAMRDLLADPVARSRLSLKDLAIAHGIATQNAQLLGGGATVRMDHTEARPAALHEDYERLLREARDVTGTGAATGLGGGNPVLKEGGATAGAVAGAAVAGAIEVATEVRAEGGS